MSPRPILKPSALKSASTDRALHAVHFPPSPSLTTHTFSAYSPAVYDRSPIIVSPNSCALPERGCPGRTYTLDESPSLAPSRRHPHNGRELHPRAMAFNVPQEGVACIPLHAYPSVPPLIPDLSSESDESDSYMNTPLETSSAYHIHGLAIPQAKYLTNSLNPGIYGYSPSALSFLPHPPSRVPYDYAPPPSGDVNFAKSKRHRERKNDSSRTPDRIPSEMGELPGNITAMKSRRSGVTAFSGSLAHSSFQMEEDGCLGGF